MASDGSSSERSLRFRRPFHRQVESRLHHSKNRRELDELLCFRRSQWISFEERNDSRPEVVLVEHSIHEEILAVVIVPGIAINASALEEVPHQVKDRRASLSLHDSESRLHHPTDSHAWIAVNRQAEAAFSVDKADDPLLDSWPFLLIARTRRIFTGHVSSMSATTDMNRYRGILGVPSK